jgi:hypothetical protein
VAEHSAAEIRAWARANGHVVADRGRLPMAVLAAMRLRTAAAPVARLESCRRPHRAEIFATFSMTGSTFPGEEETDAVAGKGCDDRVEGYMGPGRRDGYEVF